MWQHLCCGLTAAVPYWLMTAFAVQLQLKQAHVVAGC